MRKLKGFTLLELIIVMAIFSIIMYSAVQLLDPVSKFFVRSSNFENTTACVDNMRRCIEGNLKYADRVRAFAHKTPFAYTETDIKEADAYQSVTPSAGMIADVKQFYVDFFENRKYLDITGNIYVLVFDNTETVSDDALSGFTKLSDYTGKKLNQGRLVLFTFPFDAVGVNGAEKTDPTKIGTAGTYSANVWSVNQKLYGNYDYRFSLNALSGAAESGITIALTEAPAGATTTSTSSTTATTMTDESGSVITALTGLQAEAVDFSPQNFSVTISSREVKRKSGGLYRADPMDASVASFSMKNVLNAADGYRSAAIDYKPVLPAIANNDETGEHDYIVDKWARYKAIQDGGEAYDGFYFIFTNPNEIVDYPDAMHEANPSYDPAQDPRYAHQRALLSGTTTTLVS